MLPSHYDPDACQRPPLPVAFLKPDPLRCQILPPPLIDRIDIREHLPYFLGEIQIH